MEKENKIAVRINNIEARWSQNRYEIVKWEPNSYYMKLHEHMLDGWYENGDYITRDRVSIQRSIFDSKECCYTIATLEINHGEPDINLQSVGSRLLDLSSAEQIIFFEVYSIANRLIYSQEIGNQLLEN